MYFKKCNSKINKFTFKAILVQAYHPKWNNYIKQNYEFTDSSIFSTGLSHLYELNIVLNTFSCNIKFWQYFLTSFACKHYDKVLFLMSYVAYKEQKWCNFVTLFLHTG